MVKNFFLLTIFFLSLGAHGANIAISGLPLNNTPSSVNTNDSFPYVDSSGLGTTKRLKISGLPTTPAFTSMFNLYALLTGATFTGTVTAPTFVGALTGTASGNTTYTPNNHGVVLSGSANTMSVLAPNSSTALPLVSGGASANPSWVALTVAGGGTGLVSGTSGGILAFTGSTTLASSGALTVSQLVIGGGAGAAPSVLAAGSTGQALRITGGIPTWGAIGEAGGGTNQSTYTLGDTLYASATNTLSKLSGNAAVNYRKSLTQTGAAGPVSAAPIWDNATHVNVVSKTTTYTATTDDEVINASGSAFTINLYTAAGNTGRRLWIRKTDSSLTNIITIDANGSETINGALTYALATQYETLCIESDGTNWFSVSHITPSDLVTYTPVFGAGFGTVTAPSFFSQRIGSKIFIYGKWTNGTVAASAGTITVGFAGTSGNITIDTARMPTSGMAGTAQTSLSSTTFFGAYPIAPASNGTAFAFAAQSSTVGYGSLAQNGSIFSASGAANSVVASFPIVGWLD